MNVLFIMIFVFIIYQPKEVSAATVRISGNITDFQNTNGKEIECSFTGSFFRIIFLAKNKSSSSFESIAYSKSNDNPNLKLTEFGNYIFGNVTTSVKSKSKSILFNGLSCLHVREYKCRIWIEQNDGKLIPKDSTIMNITIKVRPSKPEMSFTTHVFSSTTNQNENSTNSATNNTRLKRSSPFMSNKSINERAFTEGDNITFTCDGDVGRPKGKFMWQKIYSNKRRINYTSIPTETIPENCTYSGTSNLTIQVTAEDNHAKIRCIVKSDVSEVEMSADSEPLLIYYQVREPDIFVQPNETVYKEGELVQLNCKGYGNPNPSFSWTKGNRSDETISDNDTLVIQNVNISDNGLFTCNTRNEINGEIFSASRSRDIIIVKVPSVVRINQNITKREHSNGIKLNCSYDMGSQDTFESIALAAQNITADQFQDTAGRRRNTNQTLTAFGVYLFGNATVLKSENALMLEFNNLARRHERLYKCILNVYPHDDPFNPERIESDVMNITVTAEESTTTDSEHKTEIIVVVAVIVPGIVLLVLVVVVIGVIKRRTRTHVESNSKDRTILLNCNTKSHAKLDSSGYESVDMAGETPVLLSEISRSEHADADIVKQHNEKYLQTQMEEDEKINKSHISPVEYSKLIETTKLKNIKRHNDTTQENVDISAEIHEGIKAESEESKENSDEETESSVKGNHIICNLNPTLEHDGVSSKDETIKVAKVSPTIRSAGPPTEHKQNETKDRINLSQTVDDDDEHCNTTRNIKSLASSEDTQQKEDIDAETQKGVDERSGQTVDNAEYFDTKMHLESLASSEDNNQKENKNAETRQGINERSRRTVDNAEYFDTTTHLEKQQTHGDPETAIENDQTNSFINQAFDGDENQEEDAVSSPNRLLDRLQEDEKSSQINDKKSKNDYENVGSTAQPESSNGETIH